MRIIILNADYPRFLAWFYRKHAGLEHAGYDTQMAARNASLFGLADFYSRNFAALGHSAVEVHVNNRFMQSAWAREHGLGIAVATPADHQARQQMLPGWLQRVAAPFKPILRPLVRKVGLSPRLDAASEQILLAQIEAFGPDVVLNQDVFYVDVALMRRIRQIGNPLLIGQVGIEPSRGIDWTIYDLMLSQLPRIVQSFRAAGVRAEVAHLAFEPALLDALPPTPSQDIDISFVGSVSEDHRQRIALLEAVARRFDLKMWGNIPRLLPATSPLHRCLQGEVWGAGMYQALRRSRITLNSHIDIAGREAGNMRLFEATGVGAFLLTDFKDNLHTLFEPDRDVAVWRSIDDCLSAIERFLKDAGARETIARAGQARTMAQHTYRHRASEMLALIGGLKRRGAA
ncbi:MAG TPA: glycosyltransferase [Bradyrhizobium sp.]|uniref:CgeB family protein n=1 Tax=Bradyrhizobium sp. TaxID=376 RepID=UPI002BD4D9A8|nr:glycosyltransferase [Bradyrhizobium sp.]HLZ05868.1 glycosyltransferase [Bradyrhizobium sp.]